MQAARQCTGHDDLSRRPELLMSSSCCCSGAPFRLKIMIIIQIAPRVAPLASLLDGCGSPTAEVFVGSNLPEEALICGPKHRARHNSSVRLGLSRAATLPPQPQTRHPTESMPLEGPGSALASAALLSKTSRGEFPLLAPPPEVAQSDTKTTWTRHQCPEAEKAAFNCAPSPIKAPPMASHLFPQE